MERHPQDALTLHRCLSNELFGKVNRYKYTGVYESQDLMQKLQSRVYDNLIYKYSLDGSEL